MQEQPLISICIPTYEANGIGANLLDNNIKQCLHQTYKNFEIIVSDHSINNEIQELCKSFGDERIKYIRNENNRGSSTHNTNNAILHSKGDYIKVINQDDFLLNSTVLENSISLINSGYKWIVFSCIDYDVDMFIDKKLILAISHTHPYHHSELKNLLLGINSIGSPSCSLFPKNFIFDTNVKYMIDCEIYYNLYLNLGYPYIVRELSIGNGIGKHQLTYQLQDQYKKMLEYDVEYCFKKYNLTN